MAGGRGTNQGGDVTALGQPLETYAMPIKPDFNNQAIAQKMEEAVRRQNAAIVARLQAIGEQCVNEARNLPSPNAAAFPDPGNIPPHQPNYMDWTGNLRNSIGYVVVEGGSVKAEGFTGTGEGTDKAKDLASKVAAAHPTGFVLVVVAGMSYAKYVSDKGYDVLDTAKLTAERLVRNLQDSMSGK